MDFALDSKLMVNVFNEHHSDLVRLLPPMENLYFSFQHQANEVAHKLAGIVTLSVSLLSYSSVPCCIDQVIINEML